MNSIGFRLAEEQLYVLFERLDWGRDGVVDRAEFLAEVAGAGADAQARGIE